MTVLIILLAALAIALTFRVLHWLLKPLRRRQLFWLRLSYLLMGVELLVWTGWLFWVVRQLVHHPAVYAYFTVGIAFLGMGLLTWFLLRDVVAGIIFKLQHNLKTNQWVRVGSPDAPTNRSGRLLRLGITSLVLESAGERVKIPYTQLINEAVSRSELSEVVEPFNFLLRVPTTQSKSAWMDTLRHQVLQLPWASARRAPLVQWESDDERFHTFNLRVYSLNARHALLIESHLRHVYATANE
ncbi:MAG: hypothetical protein WA958_15900 [Tunicatimonas sp.]